ncbi:hypothetical protein BS50DRAFT_253052 [Corynespora cassiicola Philippines]|uniref:CFEM domain-containing protein n=1 Tax=Corynespora cassiicola Philippines TaxID=1448308 RepID=A0A2T2P4B6_CORCC|nr:hypothetical protein BS50DRAFT_253052 [Corynespora cassiicola Philippines]
MKYSFALAALAAYVSAQSITDLPSCSYSCLSSGVQEVGCGLTDFKCSCGKVAELTPKLTPCVQSACSDIADQEKVLTTLEAICASAGSPIEPSVPGVSSAPASSATQPAPEQSSQAPQQSSQAPSSHSSAAASSAASSATSAVNSGVSSQAPQPTASSSAPSGDDGDDETCVVSTMTVTQTGSSPAVPSSASAPYPSASGTGSRPGASGTGAITTSPPLFTGAATAATVPAGVAGILGLVALVM